MLRTLRKLRKVHVLTDYDWPVATTPPPRAMPRIKEQLPAFHSNCPSLRTVKVQVVAPSGYDPNIVAVFEWHSVERNEMAENSGSGAWEQFDVNYGPLMEDFFDGAMSELGVEW
jgi:hypothetical protein